MQILRNVIFESMRAVNSQSVSAKIQPDPLLVRTILKEFLKNLSFKLL